MEVTRPGDEKLGRGHISTATHSPLVKRSYLFALVEIGVPSVFKKVVRSPEG